MSNAVHDFSLQLWQAHGSRTTPKGWHVGNAVCCPHNGETPDRRKRGGVITDGDQITAHCFNCGFKTSYVPGRPLSYRFRRWLTWLGASPEQINYLVIEALRIRELAEYINAVPEEHDVSQISFTPQPMPASAQPLSKLRDDHPVVAYAKSRELLVPGHEYFYANEKEDQLFKRLIVPFYFRQQLVGWSGRIITDQRTRRYLNHIDAGGYVFNLDRQTPDREFVVVTEGLFDAISVDGVALLGNEISTVQRDLIESLDREIIVVPDFDASGAGLINSAADNGWTVSFPVWHETCKDINQAVCQYGRLFVLKSILEARESNKLKIQLKGKKIYGTRL